MKRRRVTDEYLASWFSYEPVASRRRRDSDSACAAAESCSRGKPMRIALLGTRGIPANYGGFRDLRRRTIPPARQRAAIRSRSTAGTGTANRTYRGVDLQYLPTIRHKYFDTLAHTFFSTLASARRIATTSRCTATARTRSSRGCRGLRHAVALNVDGFERKRKKWNALARSLVSRFGMALDIVPTAVVSDAERSVLLPAELWSREHVHPVRGRDGQGAVDSGAANGSDWSRASTFLYVSRLEPENNALWSARPSSACDHEETRADRRRALCGRLHRRGARHEGLRASSCRARSTAKATRSCSRTASPTSMRPKSAARIRR